MKRTAGIILSMIMCMFVCTNCGFYVEPKQNSVKAETIETLKWSDRIFQMQQLDYSQLYSYHPDMHNDTCICLIQPEVDVLLRIARAEGGETLEGQLWVMRVILNRIDAGWANSVWDIISMDKQFQVFTNGSYINADVNTDSHLALAMIEGGWDETQGALYFRTAENAEGSWHEKHLTFIKEVDGNRYYK